MMMALTPTKLPVLTRQVKIAAMLGFTVFAVIANLLNLNLFYGVNFIFGSIAVMLAIVFLGTVPAVLIATVSSLITLVTWGHPYAVLIFIAEAVIVSEFYRRGVSNLLIADLAYWLFLGLPLIVFFYHVQIGLTWQATFLIGLKQSLNGLFNTLVAGTILVAIKLIWQTTAKRIGLEPLRLVSLLFHTFLTMLLLVGGTSILYNGHNYKNIQENTLVENIITRTAHLRKELETNPNADLSIESKYEPDMAIALATNDGQILSSQGEIVSNTASANQLLKISNNLFMWLPNKNMPVIQRMKQGRYVIHIPLKRADTSTYLIIEQLAAPLAEKLEYRGLILLLWMAVLLTFGVILSDIVSHLLTRTLKKIEVTSRDLSAQIANGEDLTFPDSPISEYASLSTTLKDMANHLAISFQGLRRNEAELEEMISIKTAELRESEARLTFAIEGSGDGVWDWDPHTNIVHFSPLWLSMLGYQQNELPQHLDTFISLLHPEDKMYVTQAVQKLIVDESATFLIETRLRCKNGNYKWVLSRGMVVSRNSHNKPLRVVGMNTDITQLKKNEENILIIKAAQKALQAQKSAMDEHSLVSITDLKGTIKYANSKFCTVSGYSQEELIGTNHRLLNSNNKTKDYWREMYLTISKGGIWNDDIRNVAKNGEYYWVNTTIVPMYEDDKLTGYTSIRTDITQQKKLQSELERMAHYDDLTNLPNRTLLADRLNQTMVQCQRHQQSLAVAFLDLDGFKYINDLHGHDVGDELLIALSLRMKEALREGDTLARFGGDEFVAILVNLAKVEDCNPILERLLKATTSSITVDDKVIRVSASIGVAIYPQDNVDADQLLRHADQAMYMVKQTGKNNYHFFDIAQDEAIKIHRETLDDISSAFARREFVLFYQPKVNMRTGLVIGHEALIRWQHPVRGLIPPLEFLPVIEGHAISLEIGEWVIDSALTQLSEWQSMELHLPISVNISAYQLQQDSFVDHLAALLADHPEVSPNNLELEILETSSISDIKQVSETMDACRSLGIQFALDDFGTGYSSLTYLRHLPAYLIKIDQTFVRDMLVDIDDFAIVKGVIALAKSFKRDVIAEGVETIEHGKALLQLGCELAQGYGIAKPMPAELIPQWLENWNKKKLLFLDISRNKTELYPSSTKKNTPIIDIEIFQAALMDSRDGITIADFSLPDSPLIYINPAFERMTGYSLEEIQGKNCRYLQGVDKTQEEQLNIIRNAIKHSQSCLVTLKNYRKDGTLFWNELSISPIFGTEGKITHYLGIQKDVTEKVLLGEKMMSEHSDLKQSVTMLEYLTNIDSLTGIHNRRYLEEQLRIQWNIAKRQQQLLTVFMIDIDYFKSYNDIYGHPAGDQALKDVAKVLGNSFLKATDFVARYAGEEFIILTVAGDPNLISEYADLVVNSVAKLAIPHSGSDHGIITVSVGFNSCQPNQAQDYTDIVEKADKALYNAKKSGRNKAINYSKLYH